MVCNIPDLSSNPDADEEDVWYDALEEAFAEGEYVAVHGSQLDDPYLLHKAAFENNASLLSEKLASSDEDTAHAHDPHGNTILHIAAIRQSKEALTAILDSGFPSFIKNSRGWTPLDEAIDTRSAELATLLLTNELASVKHEMKQKKALLLSTMKELPDYCMQLKWELGSSVPGVGLLLRRYAPHDIYTIWKKGLRIRVDGSLMGVDSKAQSVVPQWKRGHFSLLCDGSGDTLQVTFVNREKGTYVDLSKERKEQKAEGGVLDARAMVEEMLQDHGPVKRTKWRTTGFSFKPVKGWLGYEQTERVEGWSTKVYEATGHMAAVHRVKTPYPLPASATFSDYLAASFPEDQDTELPMGAIPGAGPSPFNNAPAPIPASPPPNGRTHAGGDTDHQSHTKAAGDGKPQGRKVTGRCWMAQDFPMSLQQLLPLLELVGQANKHIGKVAKFMRKYGQMQMFPVKVQVPIILTLYLMLGFQKFRRLTDKDEAQTDPSFFQVPASFQRRTMKEVMEKAASKYDAGGAGRRGTSEPQLILSDDDLDMRAMR